MIFDEVSNLQIYSSAHPLFNTVVDYLNQYDLKKIDIGKVELKQGINGFVSEYETKDIEEKFIECHNKHIDIQIVIEGIEKIGVCNRDNCRIVEKYSEKKDMEKVEGELDFITLKSLDFVIFYPWDAHMPGLKYGNNKTKVKKIVFKVPV